MIIITVYFILMSLIEAELFFPPNGQLIIPMPFASFISSPNKLGTHGLKVEI